MFKKVKVKTKEPKQQELLERSGMFMLEKMEKDLEKIAPNLVDICQKVRTEKPEVMIFLDKSARIFAGPVRQYLRDENEKGKNPEFSPKFLFYNDENINHAVSNYDQERQFGVRIDEEVERRIIEEFKSIVGKKVFVVDETYSAGRTLRMWTEIARVLSEIDTDTVIHFFALTRDDKYDNIAYESDKDEEFKEDESDKETLAPGELEFRRETLAKASQQSNFKFTVYDTTEGQVFSRYECFQDVRDTHGNAGVSTRGIGMVLVERKKAEEVSKIPYARTIEEEEAWNGHVTKMVRMTKQRIYEMMVKSSKR